jgi:hypothetical protein
MVVKNKTGAVTSCRGGGSHDCNFSGWMVLQIKKKSVNKRLQKESNKRL